MVITNFENKELNCKVLYVGPKGSGKTTNLCSLLAQTDDKRKKEFLPPDNPSPYFDFLPLSIGSVKGYEINVHLYSLAYPMDLDTICSVAMRGLDGVVYVVHSELDKMEENINTLSEIKARLIQEGNDMGTLPQVLQYNKRDLEDCMPLDIMGRYLNTDGYPEHEAIASQSIGTMETLISITKRILGRLAPQ